MLPSSILKEHSVGPSCHLFDENTQSTSKGRTTNVATLDHKQLLGRAGESIMEALHPPDPVAPHCSQRHRSRPGPVVEAAGGVFQPAISGKYYNSPVSPCTDACSGSSSLAPPVPQPVIDEVLAMPPPTGSAVNRLGVSVSIVDQARPSSAKVPLSIYYQNVRGIRTKTNELLLKLLCCDYDIVVLTETWLREDILNSEISTNYKIYRRDRDAFTSSFQRGGGVLIAVKASLNCSEVSTYSIDLEQVAVRVRLPLYSLILCCIYIRPNSNRDVYASHAQDVQRILDESDEQDLVVVLGDYNLPRLTWSFDDEVGALLPTNASTEVELSLTEPLLTSGLQQINCITNASERLLDLVFVSDSSVFQLIEAPTALLRIDAHHVPVILKLDYWTQHATRLMEPIESDDLDFKHCDMNLLNARLAEADWSHLRAAQTVDDAVSDFYVKFRDIASQIVPKKCRQPASEGRPPWWNKRLGTLQNHLRKARKKHNRTGTEDSTTDLQRAEVEFMDLQGELFHNYISNIQRNLRRDPKKFWAYVNGRKKSTQIPTEVTYRNERSSSQENSANLFAKFFETVHSPFAPSIESLNSSGANGYAIHIPQLIVSTDDVERALRSVNEMKGAGPDRIPPCVLKRCAESLALPLAEIFNRSLSGYGYPSEWKIAAITPIHKSGSMSNVENYRPISILSCIGKVFEKIVYAHVYPAVRNIISDRQHGFMKNRSTTTNLMSYTSNIIKRLEKRQQIDAIYVDFAKAFDRVPHKLTIAKLSRLGLPVWLTSWIDSYLAHRKAFVRLGSANSYCYEMPSGVPQGSHLGPLIFLLFINDLPAIFNSENLLYADDLKLFSCVNEEADCNFLQADIDMLLEWCNRNGMEVNGKKCKVLTFHRTRSPIIAEYFMHGVPIDRVQSIRDLGVVLDQKLTFNEHISATTTKAFAMLGFLRRNTACFDDVFALRTLYCSLVRSVLEYAAPVWTPHHAVHIDCLERIQRHFVRYVARLLPWNDPVVMAPYTDLCSLFQLPMLTRRRTYLQRLFVFDVLQHNVDCPEILENVRLHAPARRLRDSQLLWIPAHRTAYGKGGITAIN